MVPVVMSDLQHFPNTEQQAHGPFEKVVDHAEQLLEATSTRLAPMFEPDPGRHRPDHAAAKSYRRVPSGDAAHGTLRSRGRISIQSARFAVSLTPRPEGRVHIVGAGPVGLFLAALLQSVDGYTVRLYERRPEYTRTRMVSLAPYLVADSVESYKADMLDWQNVEAIFEPTELETRMAYRRSVAADLRALLHRMDARVRPAEDDRALAQRADRRA